MGSNKAQVMRHGRRGKVGLNTLGAFSRMKIVKNTYKSRIGSIDIAQSHKELLFLIENVRVLRHLVSLEPV